jgi:hypothetical protein
LLRDAVARSPNDAQIQVHLATALIQQGRSSEAQKTHSEQMQQGLPVVAVELVSPSQCWLGGRRQTVISSSRGTSGR